MANTQEKSVTVQFRLALLLVAAGILAACTSFSTTEVSNLSTADIHSDKVDGILYYLPIGRIHITGAPPGASTKTQDTTAAAPATGKADTTATPDTQQGTTQASYTITVSADMQADPSHEYYLKPDRNFFYDDNTTVTVGNAGLLTTGNATATDQTVGIVSAIASLIPTGTIKAAAAKSTYYVTDLKKLLSTMPAAYTLESSALKTGILPKIDQAMATDGLITSGAITTKFDTHSTTTVGDLSDFLADAASTHDATKTYKYLAGFFASHPTVSQLTNGLNPPFFPDDYQVPGSLVSQLDTALTSKDMLNPPIGLQSAHDTKLTQLSKQSSVSVGDLADFLATFPQDQPAGNAYSLLTKQLLATQVATKPFDFIFDPSDQAAVATVVKNIKAACGITVTCTPGTSDGAKLPKLPNFRDTSPDINGSKPVAGIAFRPGVAWVLTFKMDQTLDKMQTLILPDQRSTLLIDYDRMPFVSKITNVGFTNGMMTSINSSVPSPILGFLGIPKAILQAILPIPTGSTAASGTGSSTAKTSK